MLSRRCGLGLMGHSGAGKRAPRGMLGDVSCWGADINPGWIASLDFNLVPGWKKGVEPNDEVRVALEKVRHPIDNSGRVNTKKGKRNKCYFNRVPSSYLDV